jgi:hypothetical protein
MVSNSKVLSIDFGEILLNSKEIENVQIIYNFMIWSMSISFQKLIIFAQQ